VKRRVERSAYRVCSAPLITLSCRFPGDIHVNGDDSVDSRVDRFDPLDGRYGAHFEVNAFELEKQRKT
jgi:hypothetical protein